MANRFFSLDEVVKMTQDQLQRQIDQMREDGLAELEILEVVNAILSVPMDCG